VENQPSTKVERSLPQKLITLSPIHRFNTRTTSADIWCRGGAITSKDTRGRGGVITSEDTRGRGMAITSEDTWGRGATITSEDTWGKSGAITSEDTRGRGATNTSEDTRGRGGAITKDIDEYINRQTHKNENKYCIQMTNSKQSPSGEYKDIHPTDRKQSPSGEYKDIHPTDSKQSPSGEYNDIHLTNSGQAPFSEYKSFKMSNTKPRSSWDCNDFCSEETSRNLQRVESWATMSDNYCHSLQYLGSSRGADDVSLETLSAKTSDVANVSFRSSSCETLTDTRCDVIRRIKTNSRCDVTVRLRTNGSPQENKRPVPRNVGNVINSITLRDKSATKVVGDCVDVTTAGQKQDLLCRYGTESGLETMALRPAASQIRLDGDIACYNK